MLLDKNGLGASNIAARRAQRSGVVELLRGFLHTQAKVGFLQRFDFGLQKATQQLGNTATLRSARRDIARAKTILVEKQAATATPSKATPGVAAK